MDDPIDEEVPLAQLALEAGEDIAGSASGAAVGLLIGGPVGAIAGAVAGPVIKTTLIETMRRLLGDRERVRVGAALSFAVNAYEERLQSGDELRRDEFFEQQPRGRSAGEEVAEAVVFVTQRTFEERKVPYLGYLLANIGFEEQVDAALANRLSRVAEGLSWAQLVLLAAVAKRTEDLPAIELGTNLSSWVSWGAHHEALDLLEEGYITTTPDETPRIKLSVPNRRLRECRIGPAGRLFLELMWLDRIPMDEIEAVLARFHAFDRE